MPRLILDGLTQQLGQHEEGARSFTIQCTVMAGCSLLDHTSVLPAWCPWKVHIWLWLC